MNKNKDKWSNILKNHDGAGMIQLIITIIMILIVGAILIFALTGPNGLFKVKTVENVVDNENNSFNFDSVVNENILDDNTNQVKK